MSTPAPLTPDDIDINDKLTATIGIAFSLAILTMPKSSEVGDGDSLAKTTVAHVINTFRAFGLEIVPRQDVPEVIQSAFDKGAGS
jgi:hypothetical protein